MTVRVYQYGCGQPIDLPPQAGDQLRLANRFWNDLVEIDRAHLAKKRDFWATYPEIQEADRIIEAALVELTALKESAAAANRTARSRIALDPVQKEKRAELLSAIRTARARIKEVKAAAYEAGAKETFAAMDAERKAAATAARQAFAAEGLYWGTYNAMVSHYDAGRKKAAREGAELRFHRYDGSGTWTVQIQTENGDPPLLPAGLMRLGGRQDKQVSVAPVDWTDWTTLPRAERRKRARTTLTICIRGSRAKGPDGWANLGDPIYMTLPMTMHRPIPENAELKMVQVTRRKIASHYSYTAAFTVKIPDRITIPVNHQAAAVDLGWRKIGEELRVAVWKGTDGRSGEIRLPADMLGEFDRVERIRAIRDRDFNAAKSQLINWLTDRTVPDWLDEATQTLPKWRSTGRLAALAIRWRDSRFDGDEDIFNSMESWRRHDKHHWEYEANLRDQLLTHRREIYRVFAAEIARTYGTVVVEDMDLRPMIQLPEPGQDDPLPQAVRRYRMIAAPGELRATLKLAVLSAGGEWLGMPAEMTTRIHARCGKDNRSADFAAEVAVTCPDCGQVYDQDFNACDNLLAAATRATE